MSRRGAEHTRYMTENDRNKILGTSIGKKDQEPASVFGSEEHIEQMLLDARVDYALNHPNDVQAAVDESTQIAVQDKKIIAGFLETFQNAADKFRSVFPYMTEKKKAAVFGALGILFSISFVRADAKTPDPKDKNDLLNRTTGVVAPAFSDEQRGAIDMDFRRSGSGGGFEVDVPSTKTPKDEDETDEKTPSGEPPKGDAPKPNGDQPRETSKNGGKTPNQGGAEGTPTPAGVAASAPSGGTETSTAEPTLTVTPSPTSDGIGALEGTLSAEFAGVPVTIEAIQTTTEYLGTFTEGTKKAYLDSFNGLLESKLQEWINQGYSWVWDDAAGAIEILKPGQALTSEKNYLYAPVTSETVSRAQQALLDSLEPGGANEEYKLVSWNALYNAFEVTPEAPTPEDAGYTYILVEKMGTEKVDNLYSESDVKMGVVRISNEAGTVADGLWVQGITTDHPNFSEFTFFPGISKELRDGEYQKIRQMLLNKYGIPLDAQVQIFATGPNYKGFTHYENNLVDDFASELSVTKDANGKIIRVTMRLATSPQEFDSETSERVGLGWNAFARLFTECEMYFTGKTFNQALKGTNTIMVEEYYPQMSSEVTKIWDAEIAAENVTTNATFFKDKQ